MVYRNRDELLNSNEWYNSTHKTTFEFECKQCLTIFFKNKRYLITCGINGLNKKFPSYCSNKCRCDSSRLRIKVTCKQCDKEFEKVPAYINKKTGNDFCSRSCAATYNNAHKTHGTRVSKLEKWLAEQLTMLYPDLEIHYNRKDVINSELDIYIPSLRLAFELNGLFHYEPIYGQDKLEQIQNNDNRKYQACLEKGIELCWIDTSQQTYVKPKTSQKYLDIITNIIDMKINNSKNNINILACMLPYSYHQSPRGGVLILTDRSVLDLNQCIQFCRLVPKPSRPTDLIRTS